MPPTRGKCILNDQLVERFPFLSNVQGKTQSDVYCKLCKSEFNIANSGKSAIEAHVKTLKHQNIERAKSSSKSMKEFVPRINYTTAALEGVWAFHVVKANNSFLSTDCTSKLFRECFGIKDFQSARTKTEAIVTNVLAPIGENMLKEDLKNCRFVTLTTDASNHGNQKMMPVMVRYFLPTVGVRVKMLDFTSIKNETSETITSLLIRTSQNNNIEEKIAGFCGDNCTTNFGSADRAGENNVYHRLKQWKPSMVGVGCAAHVVHNTLKHACSNLQTNVEYIVVKIYTHFYINTVRIEALKTICDSFEDVEYTKLLGYAKTRFLALAPAISRILALFDPLKTYFLELPNCPKKLRTFFESSSSRLLLLFVKDQVIFFYQIHFSRHFFSVYDVYSIICFLFLHI